MRGVVYAAFNRDYVSDDAISAWDGSIDGIYQILQGVNGIKVILQGSSIS